MIRKNIRLRKEYLIRMEDQQRNKERFEKKIQLKQAQKDRKRTPTELFGEEDGLKHDIELEDDKLMIPRNLMDDEYAMSVYRDPQVAITTCRNASQRLGQFMKEMALIFPNCTRVNRGALVVKDLVAHCQQKNYSDLVIVHEHRGEPDGIIISHMPLGPTIYFGISNCVMRHDLESKPDPMSEAYPHLIFDGFNSKVGERVAAILKHLFPVPKPDSRRVITFSNNKDIISFRHHTYEKKTFHQVELNEVGPRFELKPFQIVLGVLGQKEAQKEWVLRPYMNSLKYQL